MLWGVVASLGGLAILAGFGDWRRKRRIDPDRVGWVDWPTVQIAALIALAIVVTYIFKA